MAISTADLTSSYTFSSIDYLTTNGGITLHGLPLLFPPCTYDQRLHPFRAIDPVHPPLQSSHHQRAELIVPPTRRRPLFGHRPIAWDYPHFQRRRERSVLRSRADRGNDNNGGHRGRDTAPFDEAAYDEWNGSRRITWGGFGSRGAEVETRVGRYVALIPQHQVGSGRQETGDRPLKVTTTNGTYPPPSFPPDQRLLSANVSTTNGRLKWQGHPHYQGSFSFSTSPSAGRSGSGCSETP